MKTRAESSQEAQEDQEAMRKVEEELLRSLAEEEQHSHGMAATASTERCLPLLPHAQY